MDFLQILAYKMMPEREKAGIVGGYVHLGQKCIYAVCLWAVEKALYIMGVELFINQGDFHIIQIVYIQSCILI